MSKKTLKELKQIEIDKNNEESRIYLSIKLNICPECGDKLNYKCGFWINKLICMCGYEKKVPNYSGGGFE